MVAPVVAAALIGGGFNLFGGAMNRRAQRQANAANSPAAQVAAWEAAGINPHMGITQGQWVPQQATTFGDSFAQAGSSIARAFELDHEAELERSAIREENEQLRQALDTQAQPQVPTPMERFGGLVAPSVLPSGGNVLPTGFPEAAPRPIPRPNPGGAAATPSPHPDGAPAAAATSRAGGQFLQHGDTVGGLDMGSVQGSNPEGLVDAADFHPDAIITVGSPMQQVRRFPNGNMRVMPAGDEIEDIAANWFMIQGERIMTEAEQTDWTGRPAPEPIDGYTPPWVQWYPEEPTSRSRRRPQPRPGPSPSTRSPWEFNAFGDPIFH